MIETMERAAVSARPEDIAVKLRNAPAWVTARATAPSTKPAPKPAAPAKPAASRALPPVIGWVAGVCCPGVSKPCYSHRDGETLPEQFTPAAMESMLEEVRTRSRGVPLTYGHGGPVLARSGDIDLLFTIDRTCGLQFDARLRDTPDCRKVLELFGPAGMGVSIGYVTKRQWIVERDGIGRVRVVDDAVLDHVSIVQKDTNRRAAYVAARCYGMRGSPWACPAELSRDAHAWAFRMIALQAGLRT